MAFIDSLIEMRNGGVAIDLEKAMERIVDAVKKTGKPGKLTLTLSVKPVGKGPDTDMVVLQDAIKADAPEPDKKVTFFFINEKNQLTKNDTRQLVFDDVKQVDAPQNKPREVK